MKLLTRLGLLLLLALLIGAPAALASPTPPTPPRITPPKPPTFCPGFPFCTTTPAPTPRVYITVSSGGDVVLHAAGISTGGNTGAYYYTFESFACGSAVPYVLGGSGVTQKGDEVVTAPVSLADLNYTSGETCEIVGWLRPPGFDLFAVSAFPDGTPIRAEYDFYGD